MKKLFLTTIFVPTLTVALCAQNRPAAPPPEPELPQDGLPPGQRLSPGPLIPEKTRSGADLVVEEKIATSDPFPGFRKLDANGDGRITIREMRSAFNRADVNEDGFLSIEEFQRDIVSLPPGTAAAAQPGAQRLNSAGEVATELGPGVSPSSATGDNGAATGTASESTAATRGTRTRTARGGQTEVDNDLDIDAVPAISEADAVPGRRETTTANPREVPATTDQSGTNRTPAAREIPTETTDPNVPPAARETPTENREATTDANRSGTATGTNARNGTSSTTRSATSRSNGRSGTRSSGTRSTGTRSSSTPRSSSR